MSAPEMVLEYINALKWPVVTVGILGVFRDPFSNLISRIEKLVVRGPGESELSVEASVEAAVAQATDAAVPQPTVQQSAPTEHDSPDANESPTAARPVEVWVSPDVYALTKCSPTQVDTFERKISRLAELDYMEALTVLVPADSVRSIFEQVNSILESATPPIWETTLWPGCPPGIRETYASMIRAVGFASVMPDAVTATTAKEFLNLAKLWGRNYNTFAQNAIRTLNFLPEGARVELLTADSTNVAS